MAILSMITCEDCGERKEVNHSPADAQPRICAACRAKAADAKRTKHLAARAALSAEERLRLIEEWIYDYRPQWAPPPRF